MPRESSKVNGPERGTTVQWRSIYFYTKKASFSISSISSSKYTGSTLFCLRTGQPLPVRVDDNNTVIIVIIVITIFCLYPAHQTGLPDT